MGLELQGDKTFSLLCDGGCDKVVNLEIKAIRTAIKWAHGLGWIKCEHVKKDSYLWKCPECKEKK